MSLIRLFQPNITENEKYVEYHINSLSSNEVNSILDGEFIDGVFGIEYFRIYKDLSFNFFSPPHYKFKNRRSAPHSAHYFNSNQDNTTCVQFYLTKSGMFPIEMNSNKTFINIINNAVPHTIKFKYQVLLVYRQDNWKERAINQYDDYLNGVQSPSESGLFRKIQRGITEKVDGILNWEHKHAEIKEVEEKVKGKGFRYDIRLILVGGDKKQRSLIVDDIVSALNEFSYTNSWAAFTGHKFNYFIEIYNKRKLDSSSKNNVLCTSELIPFITTNEVVNTIIHEVAPIHSSSIEITNNIRHKESMGDMFLSDWIDMLPVGNEIEEYDSVELSSKFTHALKEVRAYKGDMPLINSQTGATTMKLTFNLPKQIKFSEINKSSVIDDVKIKMGVKSLQIKQGENVGEIDIIIPLDKRQKVFLGNYINTPKFKEFAHNNPLPFLVGVDEVGNPIYSCMSKIKHLLVAGSTGSGKSVWLNQAILTMLLTKSPSELQMYMIDIKQTELVLFKKFPHVKSVVTKAEKATDILNRLINEMNSRYEMFMTEEVKNIKLYNKKAKVKLPHILCIIDEYAELTSRNSDIHSYIESISQMARSCGIHLIVATQRPSVDVINGTIKSNLPSKIGFRCANKRSYLTFLNTTPKFDLLGNGDGVMDFEGQDEEHVRFQGCLIVDDPNDENLEGKLINKIAEKIGNNDYTREEVELEQEDEDLVRVRNIILETGICKVGELRGLAKMNINKLNEIMKQLADKGFLLHPETRQSGYRINPEYNKNSSNN